MRPGPVGLRMAQVFARCCCAVLLCCCCGLRVEAADASSNMTTVTSGVKTPAASSSNERLAPSMRSLTDALQPGDALSTDDVRAALEKLQQDHLSLMTARQPSEVQLHALTNELTIVIQHLTAAQGRLLGSDAQLVSALYASERWLAEAAQQLTQAQQAQQQLAQQVTTLQEANSQWERRVRAQQQELAALADAKAAAERKLQQTQQQLEELSLRSRSARRSDVPEEPRILSAPSPREEAGASSEAMEAASQARSDVAQLAQRVEQLQEDRATLAQQLSQHDIQRLRLEAELGLARTELALLKQRRPEPAAPAVTSTPLASGPSTRRAARGHQHTLQALTQRLAERDALFNRAVRDVRGGQWWQAAEELDAALALDADDAESHLLLALVARDHLRQPDHAGAHYAAYCRLLPSASLPMSEWLAQPPLPQLPVPAERRPRVETDGDSPPMSP